MASNGLLRETRAMVFSLLCLSVSVALHSWANGVVPPPTAILAGAGLVWVLAVVLAGRERRFPSIALALLVAQAGLHCLFCLVPEGGVHAMPMMALHSDRTMLVAHLAAAVFSAGWLYAGEIAVWRLIGWAARRGRAVRALFITPEPLIPPLRSRVRQPRRVGHRLRLPATPWRHCVIRRGPPLPAAAR